jgi:hypothetical protein
MVYGNIFIMRVYLDQINNNVATLDSLEPYKRRKEISTILYSDEGIFTATDNVLKKHVINDEKIEECSFNGNIYFIDKSTTQYKSVNKIPFNHKSYKKTIVSYSIEPKSKLKFIIEISDSKIVDMYFETNEDINNPLIIKDITMLVSCLN